MGSIAITAVGADRPGIIAALTDLIARRGGNLEDGTMSVLSGHFAIVLLVEMDVDPATLESELADQTAAFGLTVTVRSVGPASESTPPTHLLSVYGADRPGLVAQVSAVLAEDQINVSDLTTRVIEGEQTVYTMALEIAIPSDIDVSDLEERVRARVQQVEVSVHSLDAAVM